MDLKTLAHALGGEVIGGQVLCPGPGHSAKDRSLSVKLDANGGIVVHSFASDDDLACKDYVRKKVGMPAWKSNGSRTYSEDEIARAVQAAVQSQSASRSKGKVAATYQYTDQGDVLLYEVLRYEPKAFSARRPDGKSGWIAGAGERRVPYRLHELNAYPDATIFVTEGEKDADRVASLGHCATTVAFGKWTSECVQALAGRDCIILEDNDEAGRKKALGAAQELYSAAKTIRIVLLPGLPEGDDVSDWLDADARRADRFVDLCFAAPLWKPEVTNSSTQQDSAAPTKPNANRTTILQFARMDEVEAAQIRWLWPNRLARGKLTLVAGDPGIGKSQISCDITARISTGASVFIASKEPQTERRLLLAVKNNLGPLAAGLGFSLAQRFASNEILASHVIWDNAPVTTTADEAVAAANNEGPAAMSEAVDFLREELANGPRTAQDIKKAAAGAGVAWRTIARAKAELNVKSAKQGLEKGWVWELPKSANP